MRRFLAIFLVLLVTSPGWADVLSGHINIDHNHNTSICWGYAQSRALGKQPGDQECDPRETYIFSINETAFGSMIAGSSLSGITVGDIVVFGQIRSGSLGHAAYVTYVPVPLTSANRNSITVDQVPYEGGAEQTNVLLSTVISAQGEPVGYHNNPSFGYTVLTFQNSFGGGYIRPGKDKFGNWIELASPVTGNYLTNSSLEIMAIDNQYYAGFNRRYQNWKQGQTSIGGENPRTISVPGSSTTFEAVFKKEFDITFRNQFVGVSGYPGTIKVNGANKNSAHLEKVQEDNSVTGQAIWQIYNGIEYTFSQWSDGYGSASRTFSPNNHGTYTANYTGKPHPMTYYNLRVTSSVGQNIRLEWNDHPNSNIDQYQVWRIVKPQGGSQGPPTLEATLNGNTTSWTDVEYIMTNGYTDKLLWYDVRPHYSTENTYADPNYISVFGGEFAKLAQALDAVSGPEGYAIIAYPNPFNPAVNLHYRIQEDAAVTLAIYDAKGRWIATLTQEEKPAGSYHTRWSSLDTKGHSVATGLYFYRFTAIPISGNQTIHRSGKLLLTK